MAPGTPVERLERAHLRAGLETRCRNGRDKWYPREYFYGQLKSFTDAGFGKRIVSGSDQMMWPGVIEPAIAIIEEAPFLTGEQKRDIFYNNAARFLQFREGEIAKHHVSLSRK